MKVNQTIVIFTKGSTPSKEQTHLALKLAMFNIVFCNLTYAVEGEFLGKAVAVAGDVPAEYQHLPDAEEYAKQYLSNVHDMSLAVGGVAPNKTDDNKSKEKGEDKDPPQDPPVNNLPTGFK